MSSNRVDQVAVTDALRDHNTRIRALEATPSVGGGIQYDVDNTGDWLNISTTDVDPSTENGVWIDSSGPISILNGEGGGTDQIQIANSYGSFSLGVTGSTGPLIVGNGVLIDALGDVLELRSHLSPSLGEVQVQSIRAGKLGFYGTTAVTQPATPSTLPQVISALQALGLVA